MLSFLWRTRFTFLHGFSLPSSRLPHLYRLLRISTSLHHSQYLSIIIRVVKLPSSLLLPPFVPHALSHIIITPSASIQKLPQAQPLVIRLSRSLSSSRNQITINHPQLSSALVSYSLLCLQQGNLWTFFFSSLSTIPTLRLLSSFWSFVLQRHIGFCFSVHGSPNSPFILHANESSRWWSFPLLLPQPTQQVLDHLYAFS